MSEVMKFNESINIFTDASLVHYSGHTITCGGYAVVKDGVIIDSNYRIINNSTSNYGELYAVLLGVQAAIKYKSLFKNINLYSDSMISIQSLRNWIFKWKKEGDMLFNSSGNYAENQDIITLIINVITLNQIPISLYMQRGHKNPSRRDDVLTQKEYFEKVNNVSIDYETARKLCYYNAFIDDLTRTNLKKIVADNTFMDTKYNKKIIPFSVPLTAKLMGEYSNLIKASKYTFREPASYFV